ncbi:amidase [Steroidobacter agaridevorans]|uniref:amidase n=1 Tax=Steroidobacter agaridevorans TaxID=2695856 RepID=UPI001327E1C6|nr:amidase [Steroidobacter agaridevorans]GFE87495.1 indole acetimide hydrolase [Steroidobacter agaridevorans]
MSDWRKVSIESLRAAYAAGETTPAQVIASHLDRIDRLASLKAFIEVDRERALSDAAASVERIQKGQARSLEGVPVAIKANIAVQGLEWNAGMELRRGVVADRDAHVVAKLKDAGAIVLGTLNMHEAALGATTDNPWFGRALNPHRDGHTPGGSSGGSGAAVAAGLCVASLGTDTLGSVRIPAAYNGVYGIKPTTGLMSSAGLVPLSERFDCIGPLARSLDDLNAVLRVLMDVSPAVEPKRLLLLDGLVDASKCEPAVIAGYEKARQLLASRPAASIELADDALAIRSAGFIVAVRELIEHLGETRRERAEVLSAELKFMLGYVEDRSDAQCADAQAVLERTRNVLRESIGTDGVLLLPTAPQAAFEHTSRPPVSQSNFTALASIAGLPAISVPAGLNEHGLPVAVQLVGAPGNEAGLIAVARELDTGLRGYRPPPIN